MPIAIIGVHSGRIEMYPLIFCLIVLLVALQGSVAYGTPDQKVVDLLTENANAACLVGNEWHFSANVSGEITLRKQGGNGRVDIKDINAPGASGFLDEKIKEVFGEKIMQCLQPYRVKIQDYILANAGKPKETSVI